MIRATCILLVLLQLMAARLVAQPADPESERQARNAIEALMACAVRVELLDTADQDLMGVGSGVLLQDLGRVVTNAHVAGRGRLSLVDGERLGGEPHFFSTQGELQLQLLRRESSRQDVVAFSVRSAPIAGIRRFARAVDLPAGTNLFTLGNTLEGAFLPRSGQLLEVLERSDAESREMLDMILRSIEGATEAQGLDSRYDSLIVASAMSVPGFSGGPVVDGEGRLVGIVMGGNYSTTIIIPMEDVYRTAGSSPPNTTPLRVSDAAASTESAPDVTAAPTPAPRRTPGVATRLLRSRPAGDGCLSIPLSSDEFATVTAVRIYPVGRSSEATNHLARTSKRTAGMPRSSEVLMTSDPNDASRALFTFDDPSLLKEGGVTLELLAGEKHTFTVLPE